MTTQNTPEESAPTAVPTPEPENQVTGGAAPTPEASADSTGTGVEKTGKATDTGKARDGGARSGKKGPGRRARTKRAAEAPRTVEGTVQRVEGDQVFVDLGPKVHGHISVSEFESTPSVGDRFQFTLDNLEGDIWRLGRQHARLQEIWARLKPGELVEARVIGYNSGGLEMKIGPVSAFMPASHVTLEHHKDLSQFSGQTMQCQVVEVHRGKRRVLISRRALLQEERSEKRKSALSALQVGQTVHGVVEKLEAFGAFVRIADGLTGLLHVSNISHDRVSQPSAVLEVGQEIDVKVLEIKEGGKRVGLGLKQLQAHPWEKVREKYRISARALGRVTRIMDFGAFVQVEPGIEGLVHISQLSSERVSRVEDAIKVGEEVEVRVLSVDKEKKRISLSRLDERGAVLGTDEALDPEDVDTSAFQVFTQDNVPQTGTNLGDVLRRALEGKKGS